ncbi:hypothetical protein AAFF_G00075840 [Aldrovandia affinis]|uniref:RNA-binding protein 34 n=1 Tax=Aldrovandia affinis TaxID=143900 RepID=A0AAD7WDZ4_9TELE|nr:hypothetical protein AAFF_G00075840 [Aldrovandia affinis]
MGKKTKGNSEADEVDQQAEDYVVGQVSGSLFPKKSTSGSSALSSLFKSQSPASSLLFVPAPKPVPKTTETSSADAVLHPKAQVQKKAEKKKSAAEKMVENRESSLQNADEEDRRGEPAQKKRVINRAEERIKNKRTVFVGNLPVSCTKKTLQILFREHGSIESIRFRSVTREDASLSRKVAAIQRKVHPKRQSINAYVVFKADEAAEKALQRNGAEIEKGFHIRVDRASKSTTHDHKRSIFVGNLPYDINELPLREHFEECGSVEAVRLVRDKASGMGKGFGYVLFESADAVQLALKLDSSQLEGRKIRVKRSVKKEKQKKVAPGKGPKAGPAKAPGKGGAAAAKASGKATGPHERGRKVGFKGRPGQGPRNKPSAAAGGKASFKGEMATPGNRKPKQAGGLKKKFKPRKRDQVAAV